MFKNILLNKNKKSFVDLKILLEKETGFYDIYLDSYEIKIILHVILKNDKIFHIVINSLV